MKIDQLEIRGFRGVRELVLEFPERVTVLVGVNGVGKSSVLDAISKMASRLQGWITTQRSSGKHISSYDINNDSSEAVLSLQVSHYDKRYRWILAKPRPGKKPSVYSNTQEAKDLAGVVLDGFQADPNASFPLIVHYSVNRNVIDVPLAPLKSQLKNQLAAYDGALYGQNNFRSFFQWFRTREDLENEMLRDQQGVRHGPSGGRSYSDRQLDAVRSAVEKMMPGYKGLRVRRSPNQMTIEKAAETLRVDQLSDGEKCLLAMVGDIARRLATANPNIKNPLRSEAIVLIDEIDLHLHPAWQWTVIPRLRSTFPNCQFVLSTHSPQILGELHNTEVRILNRNPQSHEIECFFPEYAKGLDSNLLLTLLMRTEDRDPEVSAKLKQVFSLIDEDKLEEAKELVVQIEKEIGYQIPETRQAMSMIFSLEGPRTDK
ncbi:MAG TPA: AAA family ATPase [bacterium]|jgi:predicted ATP-binding protein involved in virulence